MQANGTVKDMIKRITIIVKNLNSLDKTMSNQEKVRKILRSQPKVNWGLKVTASEEAQDL